MSKWVLIVSSFIVGVSVGLFIYGFDDYRFGIDVRRVQVQQEVQAALNEMGIDVDLFVSEIIGNGWRWYQIKERGMFFGGSYVSARPLFMFSQGDEGSVDRLIILDSQDQVFIISFSEEGGVGSYDFGMSINEEWLGFRSEDIQYGFSKMIQLDGEQSMWGNFRSEERRVGKECRARWWWLYERKE